jgi:hypothetical protein
MTLKVPNGGERDAVEAFLNIGSEDLVLKLYKNAHTPDDADVAADYVEADFDGYAAEALDAGSWVITEGAPTRAEYPRVTFVRASGGASQDLYGYLVAGAISGRLKWAERFVDPEGAFVVYHTFNAGDSIGVDPKFTSRTEA